MPGRYVPPHLRGRGGSSNNTSNSSNNNTGTNSSQGSRWRNLEGRDNHSNGNSSNNNYGNNRYNRHSEGRYNDQSNNRRTAGTAFGNNNGKSRWANVDRSAIQAGNHSASRFQQNNPNRRFQDHRHSNKLTKVKAIFFGDSFIKLFGLLNDYSDSVLKTPHSIEVQKYKAASAKGLCREGNDNRAKIYKTVGQIRRNAYEDLERLVFCFGSVDVHMSFYFKKFVQQQPLSDEDLCNIANDYVDFVASLETTNETNSKPLTKLIVGIYPSPLCDKHVGASLLAYGSLETEDQVAAVNDSDDKRIELRQARVDLFNQALKERCEHHNQQGNNILEYWDVREELLTIDEATDRLKVKDAYKDVSDLNIHLIHETTLQLWVQKWPWYQALTASESHSFVDYLQETFDEYRKTKPWAERTHMAETRGIQLSL